MKVINLFAPPGTGKTTTGQMLSGLLSLSDHKVEYVPEFAKFATLARNQSALSDQIYMFAKQENRLKVLAESGLDFVIMDGPLPIALLFAPPRYYRHYEPLVIEVFNSYENINFYLNKAPGHRYKNHGRNENEAQANALGKILRELLSKHQVGYTEVQVRKALPFELFEAVTGTKPALNFSESAAFLTANKEQGTALASADAA